MSNKNIKEEFAKTILYAKIIAGVFFLCVAPTIAIILNDLEEFYGYSKDTWLFVAVIGFLIYIVYYTMFLKCPKCGNFPGRGWFRKNCESCNVELS